MAAALYSTSHTLSSAGVTSILLSFECTDIIHTYNSSERKVDLTPKSIPAANRSRKVRTRRTQHHHCPATPVSVRSQQQAFNEPGSRSSSHRSKASLASRFGSSAFTVVIPAVAQVCSRASSFYFQMLMRGGLH